MTWDKRPRRQQNEVVRPGISLLGWYAKPMATTLRERYNYIDTSIETK